MAGIRRKIGAVCTLSAFIVCAAPTHAAEPREAELPYKMEDVNHAYGGPGAGGATWDERDAYVFKLRPGERYVSVDISDDTEEDISG